MHIDPWILACSALTVMATLWMGFRSAKTSKTASDFFVAGRSVSVGWNASAISGEYLSAASFMGVAGMVMSSGYDALWYPVCYACGYLFLLLFIAGPLRRFGAYTIPDFAEGRFDSPVFRKIAVVFVLFIGFFYTMPQMKGAGTTLAYIFPGLPYWVGVVLVGAVITFNVALGGMKGITLVQAFQYWAKMFAISVPIFVLMAVYGHYGKQVGLNHPAAPPGTGFLKYSNAPAATSFLGNRNESILISLAAQEVAPKILTFPAGITYGVGLKFEVAGTVECDGKTQSFKLSTNSFTVFDGLRRVAPAFRDLVDGFGWIAPEKRGTGVPVQFLSEHLFERVEFPARRGLGESLHKAGVALGLSRTRASLAPGPTVPMRTLLDACLQNRSQNNRVVLYFAAELYEKTPPAPTNRVLTLERLNDYFATNGVAVVWAAEDVVKVFPAASSNVFMPVPVPEAVSSVARAPLPDKAPRDDAWLNPFGPLTTKAAKAANAGPRWNLSSDLRSRLVDSQNRPAPGLLESMTRSVSGFLDGIGSKSAPAPASQFATFTNMATNATQTIQGGFPMLSALRELGLLLDRPVLVATNLPRPKPVISGSFQTRDQFVNYLTALFLTNGVHLDFSGAAIRAAGDADWERYRKNPSSVTFVPNRTWAMRIGPYDERRPDGSVIVRHVEPRMLLPNYGEVLGKRVLMTANLPTNGVDFNPAFDVMLAHEARASLEGTFRERGITIIPAGHKEVWAVPTADLSRYQLPVVNVRALSLLYTYSLIIALVCGTAGLPHILVRFYTNPDGVAAKRTTMWVMILIGVFYVFPPVFGVMGRNLLPALYSGVGAKGTDKVVLELPRILNEGQIEVRGERGEVRTADVPSPLAPRTSHLLPWGSILSGITCAGAFAAFMSTFSGLLVSMTGAMAHDVYGRMLNPKATPEQRLRAFKIGAVIIGGVAVLLGMQVEPLQINFMVGQAFAIAAASYFPLLFVSVWWRKLTMKGAATGMLTGGTLALMGISLTSFTDLKWLPLDAFWGAHPLLRILCEQPAIWAVPLSISLMVIVSRLTAKDVPADIRMKMLVLHAPEKLGLKQEYIQEQRSPH